MLWHFIIFFIIFLIPSVDGSWCRDCSGVATLCTVYTPSCLTHTHTPARTCAHRHTHKLTLNTLLPALVNPRLRLPVYKSKGHEPDGGQQEVMTTMRRRFDHLMDPYIDDDEMMLHHYERHHLIGSKEPKTMFTLPFNTTNKDGVYFFSLRGHCRYTQFKDWILYETKQLKRFNGL